MIELDKWNEERRQYWSDVRARVLHPELFPNGLICPGCGGSLYDTGAQVSLAPSVLKVKCMNLSCNWKGERYE